MVRIARKYTVFLADFLQQLRLATSKFAEKPLDASHTVWRVFTVDGNQLIARGLFVGGNMGARVFVYTRVEGDGAKVDDIARFICAGL